MECDETLHEDMIDKSVIDNEDLEAIDEIVRDFSFFKVNNLKK